MSPHLVRFDLVLDTKGGTEWNGQPSTLYHDEDFTVGPRPSSKQRRLTDEDISTINLGDLSLIDKSYVLRFAETGVEGTETLFDGRQKANFYKINWDYNSEEAYIFNSLIDETTYIQTDFLDLSFIEVLKDLVNTRMPAADLQFDENEFINAVGSARANQYAGHFSFRNTGLPEAIEQVMQREGNTLWWVEFASTSKWQLKFAKRQKLPNKHAKVNLVDAGGNPELLNVIGLDITGPQDPSPGNVRVADKGKGWKFQVGGPIWTGGNQPDTNSQNYIIEGSPPPPVRFQTELGDLSSNITKRFIKPAVQLAALDYGYSHDPNGFYKYLGYTNIACRMSDATDTNLSFETDKKQQGFHRLPNKNAGNINDIKFVRIKMIIPMAPNPVPPAPPRTTYWKQGEAFPAKAKKRSADLDVTDPWRIDLSLLTHPDLPFGVEIATSLPPEVVETAYYALEGSGAEGEAIALKRREFQAKVTDYESHKIKNGTFFVNRAYIAEHRYTQPNGGNQMLILALVVFHELHTAQMLAEISRVDTLSANITITTESLKEWGDWSYVGRLPGNQTFQALIDAGVAKWVTDGSKFGENEVSESRPRLLLTIPVDKAFETRDSNSPTTSGIGEAFIFHGVYTLKVPDAFAPNEGKPYKHYEEGEYEVHNLIYNIAKREGYAIPDPNQVARNDFIRMQERAEILLAINSAVAQTKGNFEVFPGDNVNIKVGASTNGGMIVKVHHSYAPYFKTTFYLEGSEDVNLQIEREPIIKLGDLKTDVKLQTEKLRFLERKQADIASKAMQGIGPKEVEPYDKKAGIIGTNVNTITANLVVASQGAQTTQLTSADEFSSPPFFYLNGYGRFGAANSMVVGATNRFFFDGLSIDDAPNVASANRPENYSSPIIQVNDKQNPASGQLLGFTHNLIKIIKVADSGGVNGGPKYRAALNIAKDGTLDNSGGDWVNVIDGSSSREGQLTAYCSSNLYYVRLIGGTTLAGNSSVLGTARFSGETFVGGNVAGVVSTPNTPKAGAFVVDCQPASAEEIREPPYAIPGGSYIWFGPTEPAGANPDNLNWEFSVDISEDNSPTGRTSALYFFRKVRENDDPKRIIWDLNLGAINQGVQSNDLGTGKWTPKIYHQMPWQEGDTTRKLGFEHTILLDNDTPNPPRRPLWRVTHGNVAGTLDAFGLTVYNGTLTGGLPNIAPAASFYITLGESHGLPTGSKTRYQAINGDATNPGSLHFWGAGGALAGLSDSWGLGLPNPKHFLINTNGAWKRPGVNLEEVARSSTDVTIRLFDSNHDKIDDVVIPIGGGSGVLWPQDRQIQLTRRDFAPSTGLSYNQDSRIYRDDDYWRDLGIGIIGISGGEFVISKTAHKFDDVEGFVTLLGNMSTESASILSTVHRLTRNLAVVADAHNKLTKELREHGLRMSDLAATIFGPEPVNQPGQQANYNRNINFNLTGGGRPIPPNDPIPNSKLRLNLLDDTDNLGSPSVGHEFTFIGSKLLYPDPYAGGVGAAISMGTRTSIFTSSSVSILASQGSKNSGLRVMMPVNTGVHVGATVLWCGSYGIGMDYNASKNGDVQKIYGPNGLASIIASISVAFNAGALSVTGRDIDGNICTGGTVNIGGGGGGTPGPKGDKGDKGDPGRPGPRGYPGSRGKDGEDGMPGPRGFRGHQGLVGPPGPQGIKGDKGDPGGGQCCAPVTGPITPVGSKQFMGGAVQSTNPGDPLVVNYLTEEAFLPTDFIGSYTLTASNGFSATPLASRTFVAINNANIIANGGGTSTIVAPTTKEFLGIPDPGNSYTADIQPVKYKVRIDNFTDFTTKKTLITAPMPRIAISAIEKAIRFGGGGGTGVARSNATTTQFDWPEVNPRAFAHNNNLFIRNVMMLGTYVPDLMIDAVGRYNIVAGNYQFPTALDSNNNIIISNDAAARVNYSGVPGLVFGTLKDLFGIDVVAHQIISRRAFGIGGIITAVTGGAGVTTSQPVIINNYGVHPANVGADGEYGDAWTYDKSGTEIVYGGAIGALLTQINDYNGEVVAGNSGLWVGNINFVDEGDSIETAIDKLDTIINQVIVGDDNLYLKNGFGLVSFQHPLASGYYPQVSGFGLLQFAGTFFFTGFNDDNATRQQNIFTAVVDFTTPANDKITFNVPVTVSDLTASVAVFTDANKRLVSKSVNGTGNVILASVLSGYATTTHATSHQHGGGDEIATATPNPNAIPKADSGATLNSWITSGTTSSAGIVELATDGEVAANVVVQGNDSRLLPLQSLYNIAYHRDSFVGIHALNFASVGTAGIFVGSDIEGDAAIVTAGKHGVYYLFSGFITETPTGDEAGILYGNVQAIRASAGVIWEWPIYVRGMEPTTGSNSYGVYRIGLGDSITYADHTDGIYIEIDPSQSANFRMVCANNGTRTKTNSGTSVAQDTWYLLRAVVNGAANSVEFFVNNVSIGTVTTNIPTGSGRLCGLVAHSHAVSVSSSALARHAALALGEPLVYRIGARY